jgi:hypothetical protein
MHGFLYAICIKIKTNRTLEDNVTLSVNPHFIHQNRGQISQTIHTQMKLLTFIHLSICSSLNNVVSNVNYTKPDQTH